MLTSASKSNIYKKSECIEYYMLTVIISLYFSTKAVYISGMIYYGIGMLVLGLWPTKWGVLVFSTSAGILYGTIFTVPFILVARYHAKNCVSILVRPLKFNFLIKIC